MRLWPFGILFLALTAAAYLITRWWRSGGGRQLLLSLPLQGWPDFQKWDQRSEFNLEEAAALWFDAEPRSPMWWRARRKLRQLRAAIAVPSQPKGLTDGFPPSASRTASARVPRETLRAMAEREGAHPLFLYPEFRFRSQDRDKDTDGARLASICESVRSASVQYCTVGRSPERMPEFLPSLKLRLFSLANPETTAVKASSLDALRGGLLHVALPGPHAGARVGVLRPLRQLERRGCRVSQTAATSAAGADPAAASGKGATGTPM
jgi:hypothetical protein